MKYIIILLTLLAFITGCIGDRKAETNEKHSEKHENGEHEEGTAITVSLTETQLKTAGITLGRIEMKNLGSAIRANGTLSVPSQNKALITSLTSGVLKTLNIQPGSYVRKGQVVASILNTEAVQMQQQLQEVLAQINLTEIELKRQQTLVVGNAAPLKNVQRLQTELATLRSTRNALQKQLTAIGISASSVSKGNINTTIYIKAPISGTISSVTAQIGSPIDQTTPVGKIVNNSQLHLDLFVYEKDLPKLNTNQTIHFTLTNNPGEEYDAKIFSIGTAFVNESKTIPVHSRVIGDRSGLIEGMNITALVSIGHKIAAAVPSDAIVAEQGKDYIFVQANAPKKDYVHRAQEETYEGEEEHGVDKKNAGKTLYFERIQVVKGVSDVGYTEITLMKEVSTNAVIITKGAFFALAKMSGGGGHAH